MFSFLFKKRILYFVPHQDDELLAMGVDICSSLEKGWDVHVILCTDGANSNIRHVLADGKACEFHSGTHEYALPAELFSQSRDLEFTESCLALGVKRENIHIPEKRIGDGKLTEPAVRELMLHYLKKLGKHSVVCTMSSNNGSIQHRDHKMMGRAAESLMRQRVIRSYRAFIEPYYFEKVKDSARMVPVDPTIVYGNESILERVRNAAAAYALWAPEQNRYAVGYHSVPREFDDFLKDVKSAWFEKWDEETLSGWRWTVWNHRKWKKLYSQRQLYYSAKPCKQPNMMGLKLTVIQQGQTEAYREFCAQNNMELREKDIQRLEEGSSFWCVTMKNGRIASTGWLAWKQPFYIGETDFGFDMSSTETAILYDFNTRPEYRGRGYYGILLRAIMATATGPKNYVIYTSPGNHSGDREILKAGFQFDGALAAEDGTLQQYLLQQGFTALSRKSDAWESRFLSWLNNKFSIAQSHSAVK